MTPRILGIIPARYASTRFPAKALADVRGAPMVWRVYERARRASALTDVLVATDHPAIEAAVRDRGGRVVMTSPDHPSGTDRCYEAFRKVREGFDFVINIQGDEPFIQPAQIDLLAEQLSPEVALATLARPIADAAHLTDPNVPKVVIDQRGEAIYFSRWAVPYQRGVAPDCWLDHHTYYKHIGIYAYRADVLAAITQLLPSALERVEALEQLRWLEHGYRLRVAITEHDSHGIDTPEDLTRMLARTDEGQ